MFSRRFRRGGRVWALLCTLACAAAMPVASARDADSRGDSATLPEVLVTGTRIAGAGGGSLEPVRISTGEDIAARGVTSVADVLNETPGFGTGSTPEGNQSSYAPGVNFVNLFGLGSNRTLTLVNGRRFVGSNPATLFGPAAPGNQVDLNMIPSILVDRVETLAVGGAPTYGADAIAGVVNVRLKTNYQGIRAFGQYGQLQDGGMGSRSFGLLGGGNFAGDRGNFTAAVQHSQLDGLLAMEIPRFARAYSFPANPAAGITATQPGRRPDNDGRVHAATPFNTGPDDGIPNSVLIANQRMAAITFGGLAFPTGANNLPAPDNRLRCFGASATAPGVCLQFANDGQLVPYDAGSNFGLTGASGGDGINPAETSQLMTDLERTSVSFSTRFALGDRAQLFGDVLAYRSEALELVEQTGYNYTAFAGTSSGPITLPADHPVLAPQARQTLTSLGVESFRISRAHRDLLVNNARGETDQYQAVLGIDGDFEAGDRRYDWEVYANFGRRESTYFSNQLDRQRFVNALNVVDVGGRLECSPDPGYASLTASGGRIQVGADLPVADPDCVPLDIFGEGRASQAARDYVASVQHVDDSATQRVFNANIGSSLFDTRAGSVAYNVGFESRRESARFDPDDYLLAGRGRSSPLLAVRGGYSTRELFGEVAVPLVGEQNRLPAVRELTLFGKARRVDNSVNGEFTAWTGGLRWQPVTGLELRGNVTRSLRAPSLTELYLPVTPRFGSVTDPCSSVNLASGSHPELRAANCARFFSEYGLPSDGSWQSLANNVSVQGTSQGNRDLRNESANAWTAGFVLRPGRLEGLELAVDWVDIRIDDAITNVTSSDLAEACFDTARYPNHYCGFLTRNPPGSGDPGQITFAQSGYANGDYQSMAGVTVDARWRRDLVAAGSLEVGIEYFRLREELRSATGIVSTNSEGQIGSPTDSVRLTLSYENGPFGARWQTRYVAAQLYDRTFNADSRDVLRVNADYTQDLSAWYRFGKETTFRLAVTNILDGMPPFPIGADAFNGNYDFLGRRFSASITHDLGGR